MVSLRFFIFFLSIASLSLFAITQKIITPIAQFEADIITQNSDMRYIDLSKERSNIAEIIAVLSYWDEQNDSLLQALNKYIQNGFSFAEYDAVIEALEYAAIVLQKNYAHLDSAYAQRIATNLDEIITNITNGLLMRQPTTVENGDFTA
jgi:hypothetical protein